MAGSPAHAEMLRIDREDLLTVLTMRFGAVPEPVRTRIAACHDTATLERLILVAANTPGWERFLSELEAGTAAFRLVGEALEPTVHADDAVRDADHAPPGPSRKE